MAGFFSVAGRSVPRWAVGAAVATPVVAVVQGSLMLSDYRLNHGDAPHPLSPSRGIVVVSPQDWLQDQQHQVLLAPSREVSSRPPIRLLVIGDSLAAGVGTSKSGTPILPESIARSLSKALGGRAVYWTCVGTPGISAAQIVLDIHNLDDSLLAENKLKSKLAEWHAASRRAHQWFQRRLTQQRHKQQKEDSEASRRIFKASVTISNWWRGLRRDVRDLKAAIQRNDGHFAVSEEELVPDEESLVQKPKLLQPGKQINGNYDIAIVLTGLNDLKTAILPFMMKGSNEARESATGGGLKAELMRVLHALKSKMKLELNHNDQDDTILRIEDEQSLHRHDRRPLVVFPALPASPLPLLQHAPLSWFAVPLIQAMDHNKKVLSEKFPGSVLFVESPSLSDLSEIDAGRGPLWAKRRTEHVLLKLTDVTHRARDEVERLMKQHYQKLITACDDECPDDDHGDHDDRQWDPFEQACHDHQLATSPQAPGTSLLAIDKIHPNDEGYEFWGRHIAAAIVQEWNK